MSNAGSYLKILTKDQLEKLNTRRLLAYLHRLHRCCEDSCSYYDWDGPSYNHEVTKDSETWKEIHALVKSILATREHIPKQ